MNETAFKAKIYGRVQGVGYRFYTQHKARQYRVTGYVKNLFDDTVEVYVEGEKNVLEDFLAVLKIGPFGASVDDIKVEWLTPTHQYSDFSIQY